MDIPTLNKTDILKEVKTAKRVDLKRLLAEWKTENAELIIETITGKINNCETVENLTELDVVAEINLILKSLDFVKEQKIFMLKKKISSELSKTDYKIWKYQEGQLSNAEYKNIKILRQKIRDKYTEAEAKILEAETIAEVAELEKNFE